MRCIESIRLDGFLSFPPGSPAFGLQPLNVLIGPNGVGKSNFIEAFELLAATPVDFASAVRDGGGAGEWLWKGEGGLDQARIEAVLREGTPTERPLRYALEFASPREWLKVVDEIVEEKDPFPGYSEAFFYYRFQQGHPALNVRDEHGKSVKRRLQRESLRPDQSVLSQRKDPDLYPEVTWLGERFRGFQTFREWTFGRYTPLRQPQKTDLLSDRLAPDSRNLALVLNHIEHEDGARFNKALGRFLPRFKRMSTYVRGGVIELFVHEEGFASPIPATRLSDGTIRFMAILATLLSPSPPPLVCIEEPELGLHPDAVVLLAELLAEASSRMQLVVTTHSDTLVSALSSRPQAVVTCQWKGGGTVLKRVDPEELRLWLEKYTLGDIWRMGKLGANP